MLTRYSYLEAFVAVRGWLYQVWLSFDHRVGFRRWTPRERDPHGCERPGMLRLGPFVVHWYEHPRPYRTWRERVSVEFFR